MTAKVIEIISIQTVGSADPTQMLTDPWAFTEPRPNTDIRMLGLRKHPAIAAWDVGELNDSSPSDASPV
jgi:hypothetical protein